MTAAQLLPRVPAATFSDEDERRKIAFRRRRQRRTEKRLRSRGASLRLICVAADIRTWHEIEMLYLHKGGLNCVLCFIFSRLQGSVGCSQAQCELSAYTTGLQWMCSCVVDMLVAETWFMIILHFLHTGTTNCFIVEDYVQLFVFCDMALQFKAYSQLACASWIRVL